MTLSPRDRLMVLAPHPDDETLGAGGLLQRAAASGAASRVVFVTDGDDNPWPQRVLERRLRLDGDARARWGARRRGEGFAALDALGIPRACAVFLGFPDQGMTRLLVDAPAEAMRRLASEIVDWRPTVIAMPSARDRHPDHNAVAVLGLEALATLPADERPIVLTYVVHPFEPQLFREGLRLDLTPLEQARKRQAIERHATQLVFHRRAYRRAASAVERFGMLSTPLGFDVRPVVREACLEDGVLRIRLAPWRQVAIRRTVLVVGWDATMRHLALSLDVTPGRRALLVRARPCGTVIGTAECLWSAAGIRIAASLPHAGAIERFFVKLATRARFFDRDGWIVGVVRAADADRRPAAGVGVTRAAASDVRAGGVR
jgi:LmbE family N-acetylglucosaminyl deacetylase